MDEILITAAVLLAVIAVIEIVTYFLTVPLNSSPAYTAVLPILSQDEKLNERLEYLALRSCGRRCVVLVDYDAAPEQAELCRQFVRNSPDAVFIPSSELEDYFRRTFR